MSSHGPDEGARRLAALRHDLRTPVGSILGYSELLIDEATETNRADMVPDLEKIRTAGNRLLVLIDERLAGSMAGAPLAAADNGVAAPPAPVAGAEAPSAEHGRLLVVDDIASNRDLLARRLARQGHAVVQAANGVDALACLQSQDFDLVLLDIMMPGMDGYEVLARIKADPATRFLPVIMISALDEIDSVVRCLEMGAADYLSKPFNPTLLKARVGACLRDKRAHDREQALFQELQNNFQRLRVAEARLQEAYAREKHIAEALQSPLTRAIAPDAFPGLVMATLYEAALAEAQVGGDFFDAFALPGGRVALAVADASGKGLAAAARTLQVKDVLRAFAREQYAHSELSPDALAHVVARLNQFVCGTYAFDDLAGEGFVCLSLAVLEPATGCGNIVLAGCEPPLVLRNDASLSVEMMESFGLPIGIEPDASYAATPLRLAPGDALLMMTDGVTEARPGRRGEMLGYERVVDLARRGLAEHATLHAAGRTILDGARAFANGSLHDDACLLLAQREKG